MKKIKKRLHELKTKKQKKGMNSLEFVFALIVVILALGFFFDTFTILNQHYVASREANIITRQISIQGGVGIQQPTSFNDFGVDYATSGDINYRINEHLKGVGVDKHTMYVRPTDPDIETAWTELSPAAVLNIPYQENFEFLLEYEYEWVVMGQMVPGMKGPRTRTIERSAVSEVGVE